MGRRISTRLLLRNCVIVYLANFVGAAGLAAVSMAAAKCALPFGEAFFKGVLCKVLVCLAVWIAMAGRNVADKILAIVFPITAFVACGYEHSVANMYFIPLGMFLRDQAGVFGPPVPRSEARRRKGFLVALSITVEMGLAARSSTCPIYRTSNSQPPSTRESSSSKYQTSQHGPTPWRDEFHESHFHCCAPGHPNG